MREAELDACMAVVAPIVNAADLSGLTAAEKALDAYLKSKPSTGGRLAGVEALEARLNELDADMHPARDRDFLGLLRSYLEQRRRFAPVE